MLKLTYIENDFRLEHLEQAVEDWVITRLILALRVGTSLSVEPSMASFLLPADLPHLKDLAMVMQAEAGDTMGLGRADAESIEVSLNGTWVVSESEREEGIFVCSISDRLETLLVELWEEAQLGASVVRD